MHPVLPAEPPQLHPGDKLQTVSHGHAVLLNPSQITLLDWMQKCSSAA